MEQKNSMLRVDGINVYYGSIHAIKNVSFDVYQGEIVTLIGANGAGKSTTLNTIAGILKPRTGTVTFEGKVISIKEFGAFVEFAPGKEGMVHISKISDHRINRVEDVLTLGDKVKVICMGKDKMGRMSFSIKDVPEEA